MMRINLQPPTYIIIVRLAHFQTTIPSGCCWLIAVANYAPKLVAATPLSPVSSYVTFHGVGLCEIVPRSNEGNCLY